MDNFKNLTILYVDDEDYIRANAVEYLARFFNSVYEAKDGLEAYGVYKTKAPDIIVTDIKMPKINGIDFATKIRATDKNTPIIIATAFTDTSYLLKAVELQLIKYIIKPITANKLQEALHLAYEILRPNSKSIVNLDTNIFYDTLNKTIFINNEPIKLTKNELLFFDFLVKNQDRVITYQEIENIIWSYEGMSLDALRSLIRGLRKKLTYPKMQGNFIENFSGIGYKLKTYA